MKKVESIPQAARTLNALSSLGYDLKSAVADIVDNSIMAEATEIDIIAKATNKWLIYFLDNGYGMNKSELLHAMTIGAEGDYLENDLGKFGMGLKTASLSQCRLLTVISRKEGKGPVAGYQWNRDHVDKVNKWEIFQLDEKDIESILNEVEVSTKSLGTLVIWQNLDILDKELIKDQDSTIVRNIENLQHHLRLVFHKFLSGKAKDRDIITINFNKKRLIAWDPFCIEEKNTKPVNLGNLSKFKPIEAKANNPVRINAYVLPTKDGQFGFSSIEAWENAGGGVGKRNKDKGWNDLQGYYVYRADRLITFGGWLRTRNRDEHMKLARVSIDFPTELDTVFRLNIQKGKLELPKSLFEHLKDEINSKVYSDADKRYRKKDTENSENSKSNLPTTTGLPKPLTANPAKGFTSGSKNLKKFKEENAIYLLKINENNEPEIEFQESAQEKHNKKFLKKLKEMKFLIKDNKIYIEE